MVEYILGNYLVDTGKVSKEQLDAVISQLDKVRVKLGLIAVAEGMMTMEQADEVNRLQSVMDKRFGDIAVEKGYLTDEQIGNLLKAQGNTYMTFVQALVNEGLIKLEDIDEILEGYRVKNSFSKMDMEMLKSDDPDVVVPLFLTPETLKYQEIIGVAVRTIIRCVDRHVYVGKATLSEACELQNAAMHLIMTIVKKYYLWIFFLKLLLRFLRVIQKLHAIIKRKIAHISTSFSYRAVNIEIKSFLVFHKDICKACHFKSDKKEQPCG